MLTKYGFCHISVFEALKAEAEGESDFSKEIKKSMDAGELIASATVVEVLDRAMSAKTSDLYVVEGFPKNKDNIDCW